MTATFAQLIRHREIENRAHDTVGNRWNYMLWSIDTSFMWRKTPFVWLMHSYCWKSIVQPRSAIHSSETVHIQRLNSWLAALKSVHETGKQCDCLINWMQSSRLPECARRKSPAIFNRGKTMPFVRRLSCMRCIHSNPWQEQYDRCSVCRALLMSI